MKRRALFALPLAFLALAAPAARAQVRVNDDMPFRTVTRQQYDFSCGSAALATLLTHHYGRPTGEAEVFKSMYAAGDQAKIRKLGFSLLDMKHFLDSHGFQAEGYRLTLDQVRQAQLPSIALIETKGYKHFVVLKGIQGDKVVLGDPAFGTRVMTTADFAKEWNGVVFAISPDVRKGRFNAKADWDVRPGAPFGLAATPVPVSTLTDQIAPYYQITDIRAFASVGQ